MEDNRKVFNEGMEKAKQIINNYLYAVIERSCADLIDHALSEREFDGFTGNTQTSYACGIYYNGGLMGMVIAGNTMRKPVHIKVRKGERVYLSKPYEGKARSVIGKVDVDGELGADSAVDFLSSYRPFIKKGFSVVMTTGTEYSEYLENVRNLNVLTDTYKSAKGIVLEELKPMKV
nr:MAG TPA: hypothetical protein [Caudoviricetes sp.]DAS57009.1 MAG TPA: hypothetical protein [Caudoviricetes sp.]